MSDVCLVAMPYRPLHRPSMALGLLKACLHDAGIPVAALYPNIWFAEEIGLPDYLGLFNTRGEQLLGELTFAGSLSEHQVTCGEYLEAAQLIVCAGDPAREPRYRRLRPRLENAMQKAGAFVERVADAVLETGARIVGCTSLFQQHTASLALLRRVRALAPEVITMMGGANCEGPMGLATQRNFPWVDFVVSGEADELFADLCRGLLAQGREWSPTEWPDGVIGPGRSAPVAASEAPRAVTRDLEALPIPDYQDYFRTLQASSIAPDIKPALPFEISRGCWWGQKRRCKFCSVGGLGVTYRTKSSARTVRELRELAQRHGLDRFMLVDSALRPARFQELLSRLTSEQAPYSIFCGLRAGLAREEVRLLADAGIRCILPGLESLHDSALQLLNKGTTVAANIELLKWCQEFGIDVLWLLLYQIPGDSDAWYAEMAELVPLLTHLQPPAMVVPIEFHRFSAYQSHPQEHGLALRPARAYSHVYGLGGEELADLAYYFEDGSSEQPPTPASPGLRALRVDVGKWILGWRPLPHLAVSASGERPVLRIADDGTRLQIRDTRACAVKPHLCLEGLASRAYRACRQAVTRPELTRTLRAELGEPLTADELEPVVAELKRLKILVELGEQLLSLAVGEPCRPLPERSEFLGLTRS